MAYNPGIQDRSGEILAQGISQGFSSLTQGVERYYKKKEEKEILDSAVTSLMSQAASNPRLAPFIGGANMTDRKAVINAVKGMGGGDVRAGVTALGQSMRQFNIYNQQQQDKEDDQAAFKLGMAARANNEDPLKVLAGSGQKINAGIASLFSDLASADAVTARNLAEAARVPKPEKVFQQMTLDQINDLKSKGYDVKARPVLNGMYEVENVSPFAPAATTTINTGENRMMADSQAALRKTKTDDINPMIASKANVEAMDALINAGVDDKGQVITGAFANLEIGAKSILNATGLANFEDVAATQEYLGSSVALVGQIIKQFGAGTGLSDADREFATSAAAGNLKYDKKALVRLVGMAKRVYKKRGELYNKDVEQTFGKPKSGEGFDPARSLYVDPTEFEFSPKSQPLGKPLSPAEKERLIELGNKR